MLEVPYTAELFSDAIAMSIVFGCNCSKYGRIVVVAVPPTKILRDSNDAATPARSFCVPR